MKLNDAQLNGLAICLNRYKNRERYSVIAGYAGTGKSTLVKFLVAVLKKECGLNDSDISYAAPTGKACEVLKKKGNEPCSTLHKLLWDFRPSGEKKFIKIPYSELEFKIVIVDETSMIDSEILKELMKHRETHFIFLGDPGQLPPVKKNDLGQQEINGYDLLQNPHVFLSEVMRQAEESEIIKFSMMIREGKPLPLYKGKDVQIISREEFTEAHLLWADIVLCATNKTRTDLNNRYRELKGYGAQPQEGDKIICTKNAWETYSDNFNPIVNGSIGTLKNCYSSFVKPYVNYPKTIPVTRGDIEIDYGDYIETYKDVMIDEKYLKEGVSGFTWKEQKALMGRLGGDPPLETSYGYVITCHKSQGSEWDRVLILEEGFPFESEEHKKWLYTAITRAASKVIIVKK